MKKKLMFLLLLICLNNKVMSNELADTNTEEDFVPNLFDANMDEEIGFEEALADFNLLDEQMIDEDLNSEELKNKVENNKVATTQENIKVEEENLNV